MITLNSIAIKLGRSRVHLGKVRSHTPVKFIVQETIRENVYFNKDMMVALIQGPDTLVHTPFFTFN